MQVTESMSLYERDGFSSCGPKRGVGDYLLLEQAGAWTASSLCICVHAHVGLCVCMRAGPVGSGMHVLRND